MRFLKILKKNLSRFRQVKYNTIYAFGENNKDGIRSRQVTFWRDLISIVLFNSGPNNYYGIDRIPVCTGSGMYRLHCKKYNRPTVEKIGDLCFSYFMSLILPYVLKKFEKIVCIHHTFVMHVTNNQVPDKFNNN